MIESSLRHLLAALREGRVTEDEVVAKLRLMPYEDLGFAKVDHHRAIRCGHPEVIFGQGKTPDQVAAIFDRCAASGANVMATRASSAQFEAVAARHGRAEFHAAARMITLHGQQPVPMGGTVAIVSAGTSDLPVAEEARITAEMMGCRAATFFDVGVAGIHRLFAHAGEIQAASVVVVVAGMEGALASVVGGLVAVPVIAVPTSIGYGASFQGLAALLAMLNSCAANVVVVNIDNGFGAGYVAALMNRRTQNSPQ